MCPRCGCHSEAIAEEAARLEDLLNPPSYPVITAKTDDAQGHVLAVKEDNNNFVLLDIHLLGKASRLELFTLTGSPVNYRSMQIAARAPIVRFVTDATNLVFMNRVESGVTTSPYWLGDDGNITAAAVLDDPPSEAVALVDQQTNVMRVVVRNDGDTSLVELPEPSDWVDVTPGAYRQQMTQLDALAKGIEFEGEFQPWVTPCLEEIARQRSGRNMQEKKP